MAHDRDVEVALAWEVVVEQALRDAGRRGDVVDRDVVERSFAEHLAAEGDELLAAGVCRQAGATGGGHVEGTVARERTRSRGSASPSAHVSSTSQIAAMTASTAYAVVVSHAGPPRASRWRMKVSEVIGPERAAAGTPGRWASGDGGRYTGSAMRCVPLARRSIVFQLPVTGTGRSVS